MGCIFCVFKTTVEIGFKQLIYRGVCVVCDLSNNGWVFVKKQ